MSAVALFTSVGTPLMVYAMGCLASLVVDFGDPDEAKSKINAPVTMDELAMMRRHGLDNIDGKIDFAEFVILSAVRLGNFEEKLIDVIQDHFEELETLGTGTLTSPQQSSANQNMNELIISAVWDGKEQLEQA